MIELVEKDIKSYYKEQNDNITTTFKKEEILTQIKFPLEGINRKYDATEKETTESENNHNKNYAKRSKDRIKAEKNESCGQY